MVGTIENISPDETSSEVLENTLKNEQNRGMKRSHLRKTLEKQSKRTLILTVLGMILIIVLLVIFGQTIIINFSVLMSKAKSGKSQTATTNQTQKIIYIAPPELDQQQEATNSAKMNITGVESTDLKTQVRLFVNDELSDVTEPKADGTFSFTNVPLKEGTNTIKAIAVAQSKTSNDSNTITVNYVKNAPTLSIDNPQDGTNYTGENSTLTVKGKTDPGDSVTVNDYIAITNADGSYTYNFKLQNGENKMHIVATDQAGNKTEKDVKVTYSP